MPRAALVSFHRQLRNLDYTRKRMETLFKESEIVLRDLHSVYEGLFLRAVTGFEVFLEELFLGILERRIRYRGRGVSLRMRATSTQALRQILLQGDKYLDWLPYSKTLDRAELYLNDGKPFTDLDDGDRSVIQQVTAIRHAIAHKGGHAMAVFQRTVIGNLPLLRDDRKPAGFLRYPFRQSPAQSRFEYYVAELGRIALVLC